MTEAEFLEQVDAWALGGLSVAEQAAMEEFLRASASDTVRAAHRQAFTVAALLGASLPPLPAQTMTEEAAWQRLESALPRPGTGASPRRTPRHPPRWQAAGWAVAALAALLVLWLILDRSRIRDRELASTQRARDAELALAAQRPQLAAAAGMRGELESCQRSLGELQQRDALAGEAVALLELPGTQLIPLERKAGVSALAANAVYHRGVKRAYVVAAGLPRDARAPYQVWLVRGGQRLPAGALVAGADGRAIARVPTLTLDDGVPERFQIALTSGEILLESQIRI